MALFGVLGLAMIPAGSAFGPRSTAFAEALQCAETDPDQLVAALRQLDALAALDRRMVLASFAALHRPAA